MRKGGGVKKKGRNAQAGSAYSASAPLAQALIAVLYEIVVGSIPFLTISSKRANAPNESSSWMAADIAVLNVTTVVSSLRASMRRRMCSALRGARRAQAERRRL